MCLRQLNIYSLRRLACVLILSAVVSGCVTTSKVANLLIKPPYSGSSARSNRIMAEPFYKENISVDVSRPDSGTVNASIIDPANYHPEFRIKFKLGSDGLFFAMKFPRMPWPDTAEFNEYTKKHPFSAYARLEREWVSTLSMGRAKGTVILFPGYGLDKDSMLPWAIFFADLGFRAVVVNLRGQGSSAAPYLDWGVESPADIDQLIEHMRRHGQLLKPVLFFGVSYGAGIAIIAGATSRAVSGVIAIAPWNRLLSVAPRFGKLAAGWLSPPVTSTIWAHAIARAAQISEMPVGAAEPVSSVGHLHAPLLLIGGADDPIAPPSVMEDFKNKAHAADLYIMPGAAHLVISGDIPGLCYVINQWLVDNKFMRPDSARCELSETKRNKVVTQKLTIRRQAASTAAL